MRQVLMAIFVLALTLLPTQVLLGAEKSITLKVPGIT